MDTFKEQRDFVEKHKSKLPSDLQIQYYDVVVFYLEKDRDKANALVQHISNLHECLNHPVKAVLYDDTHFDNISRSKLDNLDMTCECSTLIFVFLTKNVELNRLAYKQEEKSSSLKETCTQVDREWNVLFDAVIQKGLETRKLIPVKTEGNLTMPFGTATLAPINYYRNDLNCQLERLISKNIKTRIKKEEDHLIKQFGYLQKI